VPFFWSQHYDVPINYVGHAEKWDGIEIDGDISPQGLPAAIQERGTRPAVASIYRDVASLELKCDGGETPSPKSTAEAEKKPAPRHARACPGHPRL